MIHPSRVLIDVSASSFEIKYGAAICGVNVSSVDKRAHLSLRGAAAGRTGGGADLERANAAMVQWFERHLGSAAK